MKTAAIFGVGLIGGSFALAIRKAGFQGRILGVGSAKTLARAVEKGVIDQGVSEEEAARSADLILLAQPVKTILDCIPRLAQTIRPGTLITDAGSTKVAIAEAGRNSFPKGAFVGGHPLAGKEQRGIEAADADLFRGRTWILTPDSPSDLETPVAREYLKLLGEIGALTVTLPAAEHDRILAFTSHLPQLASTALASALSQEIETALVDGRPLYGPALLDSTRLALSPFSVWGDIFTTNRDFICIALRCYIIKLQELAEGIANDGDGAIERAFRIGGEFSRLIRRPED